jgi:hypothetical protein
VSYTNKYYNSAAGKTYSRLYAYYRPKNYYFKQGYYSTTFTLIYYDGYGYNFYYGDYGYYEYSINEIPSGSGWIPAIIGGVLIILFINANSIKRLCRRYKCRCFTTFKPD